MEARQRVLLFFVTFCVLPLLGLGVYLIAPTLPGETITTQTTITTNMVGTDTSYLIASAIYTSSSYTSLCNYFGPPFGCGSLRTSYVTTSYNTAVAAFTSTHLLVTTSNSEATLAPHAMSQAGGISAIMAAIIIATAVALIWNRRAQPPSFQSEHASAQPRRVVTVKPRIRFCTHCGTRIPMDSTFCEECGAHLKSTSPSFVQTSRQREPSVSRKKHFHWDGSEAIADYPGWCPRCDRQIRKGNKITWWKDDANDVKWIHLKCR